MRLEGAPLDCLVPVNVEGADARKFVHGQFTQDVQALTGERAILGSSNTGQGRVQMVATVLTWGDGLLLLCPRDVLQANLERFRRFTLSAKVRFEPLGWKVVSVGETTAAALLGESPTQTPGACARHEGHAVIRWWGEEPRWLLVPSAPLGERLKSTGSGDEAWHAADVRQGLPQVYPDTLTSFVPHMLNLERLDGIHFNKGCYVGQEVVARARFKGVPRHMAGYLAVCSPPAPGTAVVDGRGSEVGEVVDAAALDGGCSLLAVVGRDLVDDGGLRLGDPEGAPLQRRPLPYE